MLSSLSGLRILPPDSHSITLLSLLVTNDKHLQILPLCLPENKKPLWRATVLDLLYNMTAKRCTRENQADNVSGLQEDSRQKNQSYYLL